LLIEALYFIGYSALNVRLDQERCGYTSVESLLILPIPLNGLIVFDTTNHGYNYVHSGITSYSASLPVTALVNLSANVRLITVYGASLMKAGVNPAHKTVSPSARMLFRKQSLILL